MLQREEKGCFEVPMIHSTMLIDLRKTISDQLRYNPPLPSYHGEEDDILVFAHSAREAGWQWYTLSLISPWYKAYIFLLPSNPKGLPRLFLRAGSSPDTI